MSVNIVKEEKTAYVIHEVVERVEERHTKIHVRGVGNDATFQKVSDGWFVLMRNWPSAIWFGSDQPTLQAGDHVKITFQKV